jgi:hypothetical protein
MWGLVFNSMYECKPVFWLLKFSGRISEYHSGQITECEMFGYSEEESRNLLLQATGAGEILFRFKTVRLPVHLIFHPL